MNNIFETPKSDLTKAQNPENTTHNIIFLNIFAILGLVLLLPIFLAVPSYIDFLLGVFESHQIPKNLSGLISSEIVHQIQILIVLIPGLTFCSITILKLKFNPKWHAILLKVYGTASICMLPILLLVGFYIYFLSNKAKIQETSNKL